MTGSWPLTGPCRIDQDTIVGPAPPGWRAVTAVPLIVLVGLTGAGKTTLAQTLATAGRAAVLPDRRRLTDAVILGKDAATLDRSGRFAATARFRTAAPGGMGEILAALSTASQPIIPHLFDGLRGGAEIAAFAPRALQAFFLVFDVSDDTRAHRIASRGDRFDGAASGSAAKARALVADEAKHYSLASAREALTIHAPGRFHILNAEHQSPDELAADASAAIKAFVT